MFPIFSLHTFMMFGLHIRNVPDTVDGEFLLAQGRKGFSLLWISPLLIRRLHLTLHGLSFVVMVLMPPLAAVAWSQ